MIDAMQSIILKHNVRGGRHFIPEDFITVYSYCDEMVVLSCYTISSPIFMFFETIYSHTRES